MPPKPDAPLTKVTINLYADDVLKMQRFWGNGWSVRLRQEVKRILRTDTQQAPEPYTIGDLEDE